MVKNQGLLSKKKVTDLICMIALLWKLHPIYKYILGLSKTFADALVEAGMSYLFDRPLTKNLHESMTREESDELKEDFIDFSKLIYNHEISSLSIIPDAVEDSPSSELSGPILWVYRCLATITSWHSATLELTGNLNLLLTRVKKFQFIHPNVPQCRMDLNLINAFLHGLHVTGPPSDLDFARVITAAQRQAKCHAEAVLMVDAYLRLQTSNDSMNVSFCELLL